GVVWVLESFFVIFALFIFFSPFFVKSIIAVFSHFVSACYKVVEKLVRNTAMKREFHCDWLVAFRAARKSLNLTKINERLGYVFYFFWT
ncbi:MAG: hypothetical protein UDP17_09775, partial [Treponema sp.]|nr:hypothetical protein [Treponema sp.]